jgi:hypothetical protein
MKLDLAQAIKDLCAAAQKQPTADTGEYDELKESAIRDFATSVGYYAEKGPLFDPDGKYLCGECCFREEPHSCDLVSGRILMKIGSCMMWRIGQPVGLKVKKKLSQIEAGYAERGKSKAFGCSRCEYGSKAKKADSNGRPSWCGFWGMRIVPLACCFQEAGPDSKDAPGE